MRRKKKKMKRERESEWEFLSYLFQWGEPLFIQIQEWDIKKLRKMENKENMNVHNNSW